MNIYIDLHSTACGVYVDVPGGISSQSKKYLSFPGAQDTFLVTGFVMISISCIQDSESFFLKDTGSLILPGDEQDIYFTCLCLG